MSKDVKNPKEEKSHKEQKKDKPQKCCVAIGRGLGDTRTAEITASGRQAFTESITANPQLMTQQQAIERTLLLSAALFAQGPVVTAAWNSLIRKSCKCKSECCSAVAEALTGIVVRNTTSLVNVATSPFIYLVPPAPEIPGVEALLAAIGATLQAEIDQAFTLLNCDCACFK